MKPVSLHEVKDWDGEISCLQKEVGMHRYNATDCIYRSEDIDTDTALSIDFQTFFVTLTQRKSVCACVCLCLLKTKDLENKIYLYYT